MTREERRWLFLLHQLPAKAANGRVRVWRRLQQLGAIAVKGSAYVLPHSPQAVEDFEWLRVEILGLGGAAAVFEGRPLDVEGEAEMVKKFQDQRAGDYQRLQAELRALVRRRTRRGRNDRVGRALVPQVQALRARFQKIVKSDPIGGPLKDRVAGELAALEQHLVRRTLPTAQTTAVQRFAACTWVTRPRPGVDRMSSAWLIRTFIDPEARFVFADQPEPDQVAYDMYEGDFTHQGEACTFEVLVRRFRIADAAVRRIAEVVHDLDLNDAKYQHPEAQTIGLLVEGVRESEPDDRRALEVGISIFAALHQAVTAGGKQGSSSRRSQLKPIGPAPAKR